MNNKFWDTLFCLLHLKWSSWRSVAMYILSRDMATVPGPSRFVNIAEQTGGTSHQLNLTVAYENRFVIRDGDKKKGIPFPKTMIEKIKPPKTMIFKAIPNPNHSTILAVTSAGKGSSLKSWPCDQSLKNQWIYSIFNQQFVVISHQQQTRPSYIGTHSVANSNCLGLRL